LIVPPFSTINPLVSHFQSDPHIFPAQVPSQAFNLTLLIDAFVTSGLVKTSLEALGAGLSGWVLVDRIEVGVTMADIMGIPGSEWDSQQT
jgi:hypothetical protein